MRKRFLPPAAFALVCLFSATASATANYVYHVQTNNFVATPTDDPGGGCSGTGTDTTCGRYVENTDRAGAPGFQIYTPETFSLHFKVEFQFYTDERRIYYTTDGSRPCGSYGSAGSVKQPNGTPCGASNTTQVVTANFQCTYSDVNQGCQIVDVISGSIPPQAAGTTVRYIVSAWRSGGGEEVFANSGGPSCEDCPHAYNSSDATVFDYNVLALPPTPLIISEFRLRGPGADGAAGTADDDDDEFVEIFNNSNAEVTVNAYDGSAGFALAASDGIARFVIPNGTRIPARGHYLGVNSVGYSLGAYAAGTPTTPTTAAADDGTGDRNSPASTGTDAPAAKSRLRARAARTNVQPQAAGGGGGEAAAVSGAAGDRTYTIPIADNAGIALFNTANPSNFLANNRLDAVGSTSEMNTLYKEGSGYPAIVPLNINYSFFRDMCGKGGSTTVRGNCPSGGGLSDTGENGADFLFTDPAGTDAGAGSRLGAPGPENSASPIQRNDKFPGSLIFPCVASSAAPNRERTLGQGAPTTSTMGTLSIRRRITNNTGGNVTRLRFRVIDVSTRPAPSGIADLRVISSSATTVEDPCTSLSPLKPVQGTTLETPPSQPNGGGFNSSLSADTVTLLSPLLPGATYDFQLVLGIQQTGSFKFYVNIEALP
ncbi:MAG TPA: hypothetical protein VF586_15345 [Pyrinomonadaceae bacterium]|jgi:hypothetical protein